MDEKKEAKHQHKEQHKVYKVGDKYMCEECGTEVVYEAKKCPECNVDLNWVDALGHMR